MVRMLIVSLFGTNWPPAHPVSCSMEEFQVPRLDCTKVSYGLFEFEFEFESLLHKSYISAIFSCAFVEEATKY